MTRQNNYEGNRPLLYLVATPIGNRQEWSPRAIEILKQMDYIACEDTRNSGTLFSSFDIKRPLISCHEHNEEEAGDKIVSLLLSGKKVAFVSDAGYPGISDPGERLVAKAVANNIKVAVVNGPNAALCALVASGLETKHFFFEGFLPSKPTAAKARLEELKNVAATLIFYEAPHRIKRTLSLLNETLGGERKACLARELTKLHEEYIRATLAELDALDEETLKGEIVLVIEGAKAVETTISDDDVEEALKEKLKTLRSKEAIAEVAKETGVPKNKVYDIYLETLK